jgi:hypothetical protein
MERPGGALFAWRSVLLMRGAIVRGARFFASSASRRRLRMNRPTCRPHSWSPSRISFTISG